jgi:hypothetical protein
MVFNPAGQIDVLNLLKGEVIALSRGELKLLAVIFGLVAIVMLVFRREFLLISFDRDLAFLLKGRQIIWDILLYLLAGIVIALGVIMAGPLLIFGFLVLPALAARPLVSRMSGFLLLSSGLGLLMAFVGFYSSVRLDLPLGPTDVALGCCLIFLAYGLSRISGRRRIALMLFALTVFSAGACGTARTTSPIPEARALNPQPLWLAKVRNSTALPLLLPASNPLRSLAEMAGKISSDYRSSVMEVLREELRTEFERRGFKIALPEQVDARFTAFASNPDAAVRLAREGNLSGTLFVSEIWRWEGETQKFVRALVDFKLIQVDDGTVLWQRRIQRAIPTPSATNLGQASVDAARAIVRELFTG